MVHYVDTYTFHNEWENLIFNNEGQWIIMFSEEEFPIQVKAALEEIESEGLYIIALENGTAEDISDIIDCLENSYSGIPSLFAVENGIAYNEFNDFDSTKAMK